MEPKKLENLTDEIRIFFQNDAKIVKEKNETEDALASTFGLIDEILKGNKNVKKCFEDIINELSQGKGNAKMNFYPSNKTGDCHTYCLGIATKKFGHHREKVDDKNPPDGLKTGFKGLMINIIGYWLTCSINKTTVLVTLDWDDEAFVKDLEHIINKHIISGKKVKIFEILERNRTYICRYPI